MPFEMSEDAFEAAVVEALDEIPARLRDMMDNVAIFIEDRYEPLPHEDPDTVLLGLYDGIPLTERDHNWAAGAMPDRIIVFKDSILEICETHEDVVEEVGITVVHEIAHHFGIDDATLHELGWG
ncbi:metallopeptidase family protein [Zafaria sp. Z1313]|uniref:metallopeptidase family protein n=1 Tax=unclassified Zafaria TaxID=2828765 RepID=UPI002E77B86C|nr:metallopeptidase family protein [Zafaria sp. J156]MEE1622136.1 metallopeptidase family protein [Zafaria sp. J156]